MEATAFPLFLTNTVFPAHSEWECCSKDNFPTSLFWSCYSRLSLPLCHIKHKLAGFFSQPTLVLESAPRTQLSPNLSVLNFFICKQPHLCDTWHWEEFAVNIHKVSCFSDLFVKLLALVLMAETSETSDGLRLLLICLTDPASTCTPSAVPLSCGS